MAVYSHGVTVTWGGTTYEEVVSCAISGGGDRQGRDSPWAASQGSLQVGCLSPTGSDVGLCGTRESLSVSGGGISYSGFAVLGEITAECELNGVTRYTLSYTLCD
jgi:hypothetical protein